MKERWLGPLLGLCAALLLPLTVGESPFNIAQILVRSSFGSMYDFGVTLFYTTPLIFTGLSVAFAFQAGLFNIGAEGQLLMAAATAAATGVLLPMVPPGLAPLLALTLAIGAGALWGGVAGWLRARRGSHEVIVTILMNFIAAGLTSWFVLNVIPNPQSQNPESAPVAAAYQFKEWDPLVKLFPDTGVSLALIAAILTAVVMWVILKKTTWGFELRAVGQNPEAARRAGIPVERRQIQALAGAGALAAGVALSEILGHSGQFRLGFSPEYGFIGIAVALLARNHPLGLLASALLMGALHKGAADLDIETDMITRDYTKVIQALIILGVGLRLWSGSKRKKKESS